MTLLTETNINKIKSLCKRHRVRTVYVFGSVLTDKFNKSSSDIDLLVDFFPMGALEYAENYYDLKFSLQDIFNRKVDLLEQKSLKNPYFIQSVNENKKLIYGDAN